MKNFKSCNFIYYILISALLLSGLFFSGNSVLSFSHRLQESSIATISSPDNISDTPELCTDEMLGHNRQFLYNAESKKYSQDNFNGLFLLLTLHIFKQGSLIFYTSSNNELYHNVQSSTIIIVYIHNQDGEKPYPLL